jgi:hypothetical protein
MAELEDKRPPSYVAPAMEDLEFGRLPNLLLEQREAPKIFGWSTSSFLISRYLAASNVDDHVVIASTEESIHFNDNDL